MILTEFSSVSVCERRAWSPPLSVTCTRSEMPTAEEQQRDGDRGGDEQQERVERQQSRTESDSTAGYVELGRVDEQLLQDGEWQQQQQACGGGGGEDEEHEKLAGE